MSKERLIENIAELHMERIDESRLNEERLAVSGWTAPIWDLGKLNLNGRVYTLELANRIVSENRATLVYDSHDHGYGSAYMETVAIAKNPRVENNQLWVDILLVDRAYADKIAVIHDSGVPIGVSSVGYGETDKDGVVDANTYVLERYLDFVIHPANKSFAQPNEKNPAKESTDASGKLLPEADTSLEVRRAKVEAYGRIEKLL